jgi:hypothetical protein
VVGLINDNDETVYREEVRDLAMWCQDNNLSLNVTKTKEMIVDYRKRRTEHTPILNNRAIVEQVESFKFRSVHITNKLSWSKHTEAVVMKAQQSLFSLRQLKRFGMGFQILKKVYSCTIESILTGCITAWYANCSGLRPQGITEGNAYGPVHSCHWRPLYRAVSEEGPINCQRLQPPQS